MTDMTIAGPAPLPKAIPTFRQALRVWAGIGVTSFGGPAGQIALMHRVLVAEKGWIGEKPYLTALNFCMLLPGPEAMQLATYIGWRLHGVKGGLAAGLLFVLPGAFVILALSSLYAAFGHLPATGALFLGVKAAVIAIVTEALIRVARRALKTNVDYAIAAAAFIAIFAVQAPFPLIVLAAGATGYARGFFAPAAPPAAVSPAGQVQTSRATANTIALWLAIWLCPLALLAAAFGPDHVIAKIAYFFSKLAVVTFGGAYAVLAYMGQEAVGVYGWLSPGQLVDGLGLAETTPGPLILVTEFVGFLAAFQTGAGNAWLLAVIAAAVTLWATFAPCFLWIFAAAPYVERIGAMPKLASALAGVSAAVVGVILNLSVWFALHVLFGNIDSVPFGPLTLQIPDFRSFLPAAALLSAVAFVLLFGLKRGIFTVLGVCAGLAIALRYAGS